MERNFKYLIKESSRLVSEYDNLPIILDKLNRITAEYIRDQTPIFSHNPGIGCDMDLKNYHTNASQLIKLANIYFLKKLEDGGIKINLTELKPLSAESKGDHCNCKNFKGGMLEFLKELAKKDSEGIQKIVSCAEIIALNSLTWAYHHGKVRDPYSFFPKRVLDN